MTPLEKIERISRQVFPAPMQCPNEKRKVRIKRDEFVNKVLQNIMIDGLVIWCKR
jgi:hypothetical protein